tara:strand:- start:6849 stop:7226 length:378 start_codon:yes stop_codon:yes gene_type:complete
MDDFKEAKKSFNEWIEILDINQEERLKRDKMNLKNDWTEEVIIPEIIYNQLLDNQKISWYLCDLKEIYSENDISELFGVEPNQLNRCYSSKFYKLTFEELKQWENFGNSLTTELPINDVLIIYSQ